MKPQQTAPAVTTYRRSMMRQVEAGELVAVGKIGSPLFEFRQRVNTGGFDIELNRMLTRHSSRCVRELWRAGLVRLSRAAVKQNGWAIRTVLSTAQGRRWMAVAPKCRRGTSNANRRGGSECRRRRRKWLLAEFGNGVTAACSLRVSPSCLRIVDFETISVDRIVPGSEGGTYRRDNIQPACGYCQSWQGGQMAHKIKKGT